MMDIEPLKRWLPLAALILAALACSAPSQQPTANPVEAVTSSPEATLPPATPAAAPSPTSEATQQPAGPAAYVTFSGISFFLDPSLGTAAGKNVPADAADSAPPPLLMPGRYQFDLTGYPAQGSSRMAQLLVFPAAAFKGFNDAADQRLQKLAQLLKDKPAAVAATDEVPQMSNLMQGQMIHAQIKYMDFQNGSGVRFVTQFSSDVRPVTNADLEYIFQGITADGKYVLAIVLPLAQSGLPASQDAVSADQLNALGPNFNKYVADTTAALDQADPSTYTPSLTLLDQMAASFTVTPAGQ